MMFRALSFSARYYAKILKRIFKKEHRNATLQ
jgi:hypothetical protein